MSAGFFDAIADCVVRSRRTRRPRVDDKPTAKTCIDCGFLKLRAAFYTSTGTKDGLQSRCKMCDNANRRKRSLGELAVTQGANENVVEHAVALARKAALVATPRVGGYRYEGVRGGMLLAGYVP